jgi:hypothetical protein
MTVRDFALVVILSHHVACATPAMVEKPPPSPGTPGEGQVALTMQQHFQSSVLAKDLDLECRVEILHESIQDGHTHVPAFSEQVLRRIWPMLTT